MADTITSLPVEDAGKAAGRREGVFLVLSTRSARRPASHSGVTHEDL